MFKINKIISLSLSANVFTWIMTNGVISPREARLGLGVGRSIAPDESGCIVSTQVVVIKSAVHRNFCETQQISNFCIYRYFDNEVLEIMITIKFQYKIWEYNK